MLVKILLGIAVALIVFAAVVATRPSAYHVERRLTVAAPAEAVFGVLNDLHRFSGIFVLFGDLFEQRDPNAQKTFAGPASGVGQSFSWSGKEAGEGSLTIEESVPPQKVGLQLVFVKPMASKAKYTLAVASTAAGSEVTWTMDGDHNFIGKAFGMFVNMDNMMGADLEKSLAELKTVAEHKPPAAR